ncbi:hypothetical protein UPYG_G00329370 [Umbra pygmaea]|uniref:Macro domain-containing protein n=1 Tax=Umbra pygmaea TaxID=75934 RepID=A0ABD0W2I5_UMBPY
MIQYHRGSQSAVQTDVIHTVGPIARGVESDKWQETEQYLKACYTNSLERVLEKNLRTVAFPCISTGIYGFPNKPASDIALNTVIQWVKDNYDQWNFFQLELVLYLYLMETSRS